MMTENHTWVRDLLNADQSTPLPESARAAIVAAIRAEVAHRGAGDLAVEATDAVAEVELRSSTGTFGVNPPAHYDKPGLGMRVAPDFAAVT